MVVWNFFFFPGAGSVNLFSVHIVGSAYYNITAILLPYHIVICAWHLHMLGCGCRKKFFPFFCGSTGILLAGVFLRLQKKITGLL